VQGELVLAQKNAQIEGLVQMHRLIAGLASPSPVSDNNAHFDERMFAAAQDQATSSSANSDGVVECDGDSTADTGPSLPSSRMLWAQLESSAGSSSSSSSSSSKSAQPLRPWVAGSPVSPVPEVDEEDEDEDMDDGEEDGTPQKEPAENSRPFESDAQETIDAAANPSNNPSLWRTLWAENGVATVASMSPPHPSVGAGSVISPIASEHADSASALVPQPTQKSFSTPMLAVLSTLSDADTRDSVITGSISNEVPNIDSFRPSPYQESTPDVAGTSTHDLVHESLPRDAEAVAPRKIEPPPDSLTQRAEVPPSKASELRYSARARTSTARSGQHPISSVTAMPTSSAARSVRNSSQIQSVDRRGASCASARIAGSYDRLSSSDAVLSGTSAPALSGTSAKPKVPTVASESLYEIPLPKSVVPRDTVATTSLIPTSASQIRSLPDHSQLVPLPLHAPKHRGQYGSGGGISSADLHNLTAALAGSAAATRAVLYEPAERPLNTMGEITTS
jgi:hypothetical protein